MKKTVSLLTISLLLFCSCSENPRGPQEAKAPDIVPPDTLGFVGQWKGSYTDYAYKISVDLEIKKVGTDLYGCTWTTRDQFGSNRKTYNWNAKYGNPVHASYENPILVGKGNINGFDSVPITIYGNNGTGTYLDVSILFPENNQPWNISFSH